MFYTYNDNGAAGSPTRFNGSLAVYIATYLSYPVASSVVCAATVPRSRRSVFGTRSTARCAGAWTA